MGDNLSINDELNHFIIQISYRMSIKIVIFGESTMLSRFVEKSQGGQSLNSDEAVTVETVFVGECPYLLFVVKDRTLVSEQATGTNGLLFFLGGETPLFEEKQYLLELISSRVQFDGVPVAVIFERGQQLTLKDVVNYMELYRLKERASMIKEISWEEPDWVGEVYGWVKAQADQLGRGRGFQAAPKVVKLKPKYREEVQEESEKKYEGMLSEQEVREKAVKAQQELYIEREKERLKQENMEKQLSNFSKNKKKMAPYDIKPTANPKIEPNLHFFLKDPNAQPPPEASIKIQTDEFKDRPPAPAYKPKKTGINTATQIEQDELFNFDKEVKPILAILTTKALESAALQIEQQEELLKMAKYKTAYEERVRRQKEHEQKNIEEELQLMREKEKLLTEQRERAQTRKRIQQRTQFYQMANDFLEGIYLQTTNKLVTANAYPDSLTNHLATDYLSEVINKAAVVYQKLVQNQKALEGVFEADVVESIQESAKRPKAERERAKKRLQARMTNRVGLKRRVHILYRHDYQQFSNFSKHLSRHFDGSLEDHVRVREEQIQECTDKVQGGETAEEELHKLKLKDSTDFASTGHSAFLINNQREVCFTWTSNRYEKISENYMTNGLLFLDKEGDYAEEMSFEKVPASQQSYVRVESQLREARECVNMDEGLVINLAKVPENIKAILLLTKISDVQRFRAEAEAKKVRNAAFGVEFWERKVGIHQKNIGEAIKWEELVKVVQGQQPPSQNVVVVSYILRRRTLPEYWNLEDISYVSQPLRSQEEQSHFIDELSRFYVHSHDYLKEQEDEERVERVASPEKKAPSKEGSRARSKKVIEEQPKKRIVLKVCTRILNEVEIDVSEGLQKSVSKLSGSVEEWKEFMEICDNGWQLWSRGKKLASIEQLGQFRKIGDLQLRRIPKVEEPKIEKVEQGGAGQEQQQE